MQPDNSMVMSSGPTKRMRRIVAHAGAGKLDEIALVSEADASSPRARILKIWEV
jgi:hypothetical protein